MFVGLQSIFVCICIFCPLEILICFSHSTLRLLILQTSIKIHPAKENIIIFDSGLIHNSKLIKDL